MLAILILFGVTGCIQLSFSIQMSIKGVSGVRGVRGVRGARDAKGARGMRGVRMQGRYKGCEVGRR